MMLSVTEFARFAKVNVSWIRHLCGAGRMPGAVKIGKQWCIPEKSLDKFKRNR